ncbi:MAG: hypothetical protein M3132_06725 [Actinomycetia bacterium]|nr:hypothetical protein [Actinomycetes bacterium]
MSDPTSANSPDASDVNLSDPSQLNRRLAAIQDKLLALPSDAFAERWELRTQQDQLRGQAAGFAYAMYEDKFDDELLVELRALRDQMKTIEKQRIDLVVQAGSGGMSNMGNLGGVAINKGIDDAQGLPKIKAKIGLIKGILTDRGVTIPVPD